MSGNPYALSLGLLALLSLGLASYGWRRRGSVPGGPAFAVFNLGVAVWTVVYILELRAQGAEAVFWANAAYFGIVLLPASWLVFALRYAGHGRWVTRGALALLGVEPVATLFLAWTNPWHRWFRRSLEVTPSWEPGPAFWVHAAYSYALLLVGTGLVARCVITGPRRWRGQAAALVIAALAPWTANALYLSGLSPFGNLDPSPFAFGLTSLAVAWVLSRDLEERVLAAERVLVESHSLLNAIIEGTTDAVYVKDLEGRYLMINAAGARNLSRTVEAVIGKDDRALFPPETAAAIIKADREVMTTGREQVLEEVVTAGGVTRTYDSTRSVYRDAQGNVIGLIGIACDVTEMRRLEEQFREAQRMEAVGRLAGGVAHDFNNMLGVITGHGELVLRRLAEDDPLRSKLEQILKAAERAAALTRQLLAFGRQQVLQPKVLDLNIVVSELDEMLRHLVGENIVLVTKLSPGLGSVETDQGQIQQVVMNLAVNARDAMPDGGHLRIETSNFHADEEWTNRYPLMKPGSYVMLVITDTGSGMDESTRSRVFEPFFTTKGLGRGTGLGLSTVYGIVRQSGGYIYVDSEVGIGTTFRIYLPRVEGRALHHAEEKSSGVGAGDETVLLVEDEAALRELLCETLADSGYRVLVARDGVEAPQVAGAHSGPIHLMVTDVIMPGVTGRKAAEMITQARPDMKVLYMSGYTDDAILRHGVLSSAAFLQKPFTPDALCRKVRELLNAG